MIPITYKLDVKGPASAHYYPAVSLFTDDVLARAELSIGGLARAYRHFLIEYSLEEPRSEEEYSFELLNLGILWRRYGNVAMAVRIAPFRMLAFLSEWRKRHQRIKPAVDVVRGILMSVFLVPFEPGQRRSWPSGLRDLEHLVRWLEATGDFREDALRFVRWLAYWSSFSREEFDASMRAILEFSDWFESASTARMGNFTPRVDAFVQEHEGKYRWREDRFVCLRSRVEYHLNMVGAEIMNRAFRSRFVASGKKAVLLPGCMRLRAETDCEGNKSHDGVRCSGCEPQCRVNQLRVLGQRRNFDVVIIPHSSDLSLWGPKPGKPVTGVVASACLSVLVQGGWELKRYGVPAQCVLLNECGCSKHWHATGIPTKLDVGELKRLLNTRPEIAAQPVHHAVT